MATPLRVLLIEDSEDDATLVIRELRRGGYEPVWRRVETAETLTAALSEQPWDVITCDYVMPQFSGPAALHHLRTMGVDLPVIIVSGQVGEEVAVMAMRAGAQDYVSKHRLTRLVPAIARELAEAEERRARRHAEDVYRALFVYSLQGLSVWQDGRMVVGNPALAELTGYSLEEHAAMDPVAATKRIVHPDDQAALLEATQRWLTDGTVGPRQEFRIVRKDGSIRRVMTANVTFFYIGRPATLMTWVDITDRWRAEAALRQLNSELETRVGERTAELEATARELEAFSYSVSHDLRAPLRTIDGFARAVLDDCAAVLPAASADHLRRVRRATQRMAELIDQLLLLSRVMRGELRRERVDLSATAREVAAELARHEPERHVAVAIEDGLMVRGDATLLRSMLANLLGNAWKFTRPRPQAHIALGYADGAYFVRDNGVGFEMAYADKLFHAFQRLHTPAEFEGSGIGLATVQRIVLRHGGRVWAEGAVGVGATFYFTLGG